MLEYRMLSKKGEGTFSEVLKCQNTRDGTYWACKKMKQHYQSADEVKSIREIQALRNLSSNEHILQLQEVIFERKTGTLNLIFELMDQNLYELIRSQRTYFSNERCANFMLQLLKAVEHMHKYGYFHRDIKPENILVKGDLLKLADFGSVRKINTAHPYTEYISTRWYRAPECLLTDGFYSYPMDIWSIGCVMFEILTLHPLFPGSNEIDQIDKIHDILGTPDPSLLEKFRLQSRSIRYTFKPKKGIGLSRYMPNLPRDAVDLVGILCIYDPDRRVSAHRALKHRYFNTIKEILSSGGDKENETVASPDNENGRQSKLSSEPNSVVEMRSDVNNAVVSTELFKPIFKRKKYNTKNFSNLNPTTLISSKPNIISGTSLSALNQTNSTSLSVLSNYSDTNPSTTKASSSNHPNFSNSNLHLKYPMKKNFLFNPNALNVNGQSQHLTLPKLSNSTNTLQYVQYRHQPSPTIQNVFNKMNQHHSSGLPNLYSTGPTTVAAPTGGQLFESKIIGGGGARLHSKYS